MTNLDRRELRKSLRAKRNALSAAQQQQAAALVSQQIQAILPAQDFCVATYLANDGEIDLAPTITACQQRGSVTLPVLHPFTGKHLLFQHYTGHTHMTFNRFGISEPAPDSTAIRLLSQHDLLLMPLVGFDAAGNRLGMGGGFYDRTLANVHHLAKRPVLVGVAHDCQQVEQLPVEAWDIPLDLIVTPTQIIRIS
ncbi:5-formyltetrahydrofolate cyclo-ligase [Alteromonas lipolytica]|uniref:5-formyltetrahydrofolate cyclo-ligase n=1 Tax=Alteromonas lipolytica TaxID=1856405 RepID=A0A1E8FDH0_9ALTE|nr:5-formyltetrahydrofolate cyclo-ligase [Alteromonas lipolytica]OFI33959.1 5-formyltetrahydrofolate cyclo-ligase [Alteromonas lipolytica]GGF66912.1 5-formyltetrahydrofolate cyclo-ligase [Alteromonas lipolytica]